MTESVGKRVRWGVYPDSHAGSVYGVRGDVLLIACDDGSLWEMWSGAVKYI